MKKIKLIAIALLFIAGIVLTSCHAQEPPCPAYASIDQIDSQNV